MPLLDKWISLINSLWVSYDDGIYMQQKIQTANGLCLGGTMIRSLTWMPEIVTSMNDFLGAGKANGVGEAQAQ